MILNTKASPPPKSKNGIHKIDKIYNKTCKNFFKNIKQPLTEPRQIKSLFDIILLYPYIVLEL